MLALTPTRQRPTAGFTLIELMVTIAIAGVLMLVAVPGYRAYAQNTLVSQASGSFANAVQLARANAMRASRHTVVQVRDAALGWTGGWRVYTDINRDREYTAGTDALIVEQAPLDAGVMSNGASSDDLDNRGTAANGYVMFNPGGFPRNDTDGATAGSVVFFIPEGRATAVVYSNTGRVRRCRPSHANCRSS